MSHPTLVRDNPPPLWSFLSCQKAHLEKSTLGRIVFHMKWKQQSNAGHNMYKDSLGEQPYAGSTLWWKSHLAGQSFGVGVIWHECHFKEVSFGLRVIQRKSYLVEGLFMGRLIGQKTYLAEWFFIQSLTNSPTQARVYVKTHYQPSPVPEVAFSRRAISKKSHIVERLFGGRVISYKSYLVEELLGGRHICFKTHLVEGSFSRRVIWRDCPMYIILAITQRMVEYVRITTSTRALGRNSSLTKKLFGSRAL